MTKSVEDKVSKIAHRLTSREWKLVTAESCTGGGLAYFLTNVPGSSDWFERGFVTYSNSAKEEMLGVQPLTLTSFGAVSEQTVREMAEGALQQSQGQISIAITGIAGPSGGSVEKPVGTVWFGWAGITIHTQSTMKIFTGSRQDIREQSIAMALDILIDLI